MANDADIIFAMDTDVYNTIIKEYSQPQKKVVDLDILDMYFGWQYNREMMIALCTENNRGQWEDIWNRPEVKHQLSLYDVLKIKKCCFEQYIK